MRSIHFKSATLFIPRTYINFDPKNEDYQKSESDLGLEVGIRIKNLEGDFDQMILPTIALNENLLIQYPDQIDDLGLKIKVNEETFDNFFTQETELEYENFTLKTGQKFSYQGQNFILHGFDNKVEHPNYEAEEDDIAIKGLIQSLDNPEVFLNPVYVIRNQRPFSIKDYEPSTGLHCRLGHIDPKKEIFVFQIAKDKRPKEEVVVEIAENVPRTDLIVIKAQVFPGINLFWLGTCTMLLGFFLAFFLRYKSTHA